MQYDKQKLQPILNEIKNKFSDEIFYRSNILKLKSVLEDYFNGYENESLRYELLGLCAFGVFDKENDNSEKLTKKISIASDFFYSQECLDIVCLVKDVNLTNMQPPKKVKNKIPAKQRNNQQTLKTNEIVCRKCGRKIDSDSDFCSYCGKRI